MSEKILRGVDRSIRVRIARSLLPRRCWMCAKRIPLFRFAMLWRWERTYCWCMSCARHFRIGKAEGGT